MKHRIRLTESDLHRIVKDVLKETIDELTIPQASVGGIYNALAMDDINNGNSNVTFGSGSKPSYDRLEKSNEIEWKLLSKAISDSMDKFTLYFVQPDGGIGNKTIQLEFDSILNVGNNGFILYGNGKVSGKKVCRGKFVDDFRKIKIFYNVDTKSYSWINTYKINNERYIRATSRNLLILPKGDGNVLLENKNNEAQLFSLINEYIELVNSRLPINLQLKLKL